MKIILKAFDDDMGKFLTESIANGLPIETCISIVDDPNKLPDLDEKVEHIFLSAKALRAGQYPHVDWNTIAPLDEELIESMRDCEAVFLKMVGRYAIYLDIPYDERKRQYLRHLRYWNHMLDEKKIDLFVMRGAPHQCYDLVIWDLCKRKGIRTITIPYFFLVDAFSVGENWEEVGKQIGDRTAELQKQYTDPNVTVPLSPEYEEYYSIYTNKQKQLWYIQRTHPHLTHSVFLAKWLHPALTIMQRNPSYFLKCVISPDFWRRKWRHHQTRACYDSLVEEPDLTVPYIYVPLHMQPEATTCPMAGVYVDQELMVQVLAACLPKGVRIYVKEHPNQGELWRDVEFYQTLHAIPSVTLISRTFSSFELTEHAVATATATGTACFEGLFREKPAIMFGHKFFQYAPGVHRVRTTADCRRAIENIFVKQQRHTLRDMRIYLKAIEDVAGVGLQKTCTVRPPETRTERAVKMGEYVRQRIEQNNI